MLGLSVSQPRVGFRQMAIKSAIRRAGRLVPIMPIQSAVALETMTDERGIGGHIDLEGNLHTDSKAETYPDRVKSDPEVLDHITTPESFSVVRSDGSTLSMNTVAAWEQRIGQGIDGMRDQGPD